MLVPFDQQPSNSAR